MPYTGQVIKKLVSIGKEQSDCWEWKGKINMNTGYGHKQFNKKTILAHRWMYSIFNGHIDDSLVIDHLCGNRSCVNPTHLEAVTQSENCRRGEGTKLTRVQALEIKQLLKTAEWGGRQKIADRYGVSPALISDIKYGRAWADV